MKDKFILIQVIEKHFRPFYIDYTQHSTNIFKSRGIGDCFLMGEFSSLIFKRVYPKYRISGLFSV